MNYAALIKAINSATTQLQGRAAVAVNHALVLRNWLVGAYLVEFEQKGLDRAKYGTRLLETLAHDMASREVKGLDARTLRDCRFLFQLYPQIRGSVSPELLMPLRIRGSVTRELPAAQVTNSNALSIRGTLTPELPTPLSPELLLRLSWSQLQELIRLDDSWKRAFFENECLKGHWSGHLGDHFSPALSATKCSP